MVKDNQAYFDVGQGSGPYLQQNITISPDTWHHIAAVHSRSGSASTLKVYLNGVDIGGTTSGSGLPQTITAIQSLLVLDFPQQTLYSKVKSMRFVFGMMLKRKLR